MIQSFKHIYYRGVISSCNYSCNYCPFAKKKYDLDEIDRDRVALERFLKYVENNEFEGPVSIFITPYGEGMVHPYYMDALIKLASLEIVAYVSIQTNLSFDDKVFRDKIVMSGVDKGKLKLWASYHPSMVSSENFAYKANEMGKLIDISVGMVAVIGERESILELKKQLSPHIYLWLNAQARRKGSYDKVEILALQKIDPFFLYEFNTIRHHCGEAKSLEGVRHYDTCQGGESSCFIEANGDVLPCHMNKHPIGNLYKVYGAEKAEFICKRKLCDCYLAYSNLPDIAMANFFGKNRQARIPEARKFEAVFLDIDGTLTDRNGKIRKSLADTLVYLENRAAIYLSTSLSYEMARKKCQKIWEHISGGIFSNGACTVDFISGKYEVKPISSEKVLKLLEVSKLDSKWLLMDTTSRGEVIRVQLPRSLAAKIEVNKDIKIVFENQKGYIQDLEASKTAGIKNILDWNDYSQEEIIVVGNSKNDEDMMLTFRYSVAVLNSPQKIKANAYYILDVEHLPYIIK